MNVMMALFLFQWFEAILAKLIIIPYQIGYVNVFDSSTSYVSWWSRDVEEMISVEENSERVSYLIIASFLVWHYAYSMIFGILNLGIERIFASVLLKDYENKQRRYIPIVLLITTHFITIPFSILVLTNRTGFYMGTSPCFINSFIVFSMFLIVWKVNEHRRKRMETPGPHCDYSLAQQFQVKENYRALKLAKNLLIVVLCAMFLSCLLLTMLVVGWISSFKTVLINVMENAIYLNPIIICTALMCSSPTWRTEYLKQFPVLRNLKSLRVFVVRPKSADLHQKSADEGVVYFEQLKKAWV